MSAPYEVGLALRYLRFHRGRTFLSIITMISVAGVAVGTAALVIALSLMTGFAQDVRARILKGSAHLQVLASGEAAFEGGDAVAAKVAGMPGVAAAGPVMFTPAMITNEDAGLPAYGELHGIDPVRQGHVSDLDGTGGDPFAPLRAEPDGVILGADLAARLGVHAGDSVRILVPRVRLTPFAPIPRSRLMKVAGTFRTDAFPQDSQRAYVSIDAARRLLDAPGRATWIEVRLDDLRELEPRKAEISRALGDGWLVMDLLEQNRDLLKALNTEKLILFLAIGLIVVVASLNIVSTLILMVNDKIREIGTLTSMGARPREIATVFVLQGVVIGVAGAALGLLLGAAASWWLDAYRIIKLNPDVYFIDHVPFATRPVDLVAVAALTLVVSFVATLYPAWKAATLDPVDALRYE